MAKKRATPAHAPKQTKPTTATVTNPDRWDRTHGGYIAGRAAIDGADAIAAQMEAYWGCDRLRLVVSTELREKFDRQRYLLNAAIHNGTLEEVRNQSARMVLAWTTLDRGAREASMLPLAREVWEVTLGDGTVAAIVPTTEHAKLILAEGRKISVFTLEEIARLLDLHKTLMQVKMTFPGAEVTRVYRKVTDPLDGIGRATTFEDDMPPF